MPSVCINALMLELNAFAAALRASLRLSSRHCRRLSRRISVGKNAITMRPGIASRGDHCMPTRSANGAYPEYHRIVRDESGNTRELELSYPIRIDEKPAIDIVSPAEGSCWPPIRQYIDG